MKGGESIAPIGWMLRVCVASDEELRFIRNSVSFFEFDPSELPFCPGHVDLHRLTFTVFELDTNDTRFRCVSRGEEGAVVT